MKRLMMFASLLLSAPLAFAGTPRVDARQDRQERRIEQGEVTGELTRPEENRLEAQQARIQRWEHRAMTDGVFTIRERVALQRIQNRASRNIYRQKHDCQFRCQ
jgi:hypothetical protein